MNIDKKKRFNLTRLSRKSNGLSGTLFFIWGDSTFKTKIDLKRSEDPFLLIKTAILNLIKKQGVSRQPEKRLTSSFILQLILPLKSHEVF
ncbi:hypothetical protein [Paenibacillus sp. 1182]|uniref:hypothetical protein n=1 Tax=Paenibacillus sp. 1182 TaxID=2806565 RepID=UPI0037C6298A